MAPRRQAAQGTVAFVQHENVPSRSVVSGQWSVPEVEAWQHLVRVRLPRLPCLRILRRLTRLHDGLGLLHVVGDEQLLPTLVVREEAVHPADEVVEAQELEQGEQAAMLVDFVLDLEVIPELFL